MTDEPGIVPDGGETWRLWAIQQASITALVGQRISTKLSGDQAQIRYSVAADAGTYGEGMPLILVECWGRGSQNADDGTASRIARNVVAAVERLSQLGSIESGPYSSPDPTTHRPRWIVTVRLLTFTT